jgi:G3E family GTPase
MAAVNTIPVLVVGGYLGAGKTTFINQLLSTAKEPIAVLVNDFGSVNIDAALIAEQHADTIELTNGCVCCVIGDSLVDALQLVASRTTPPTEVIIEASGVADPAKVAEYAYGHGFHLAGIVTMVDATTVRERHADVRLARTIERQIIAAHEVRITKADIAPLAELKLLDEWLQTVKHSATPTMVDHLALHTTNTMDFPAGDAEFIRNWVEALPADIVRAKGIARTASGSCVLVQRVGNRTTITPSTANATQLVVIRVGN